METKETKPTEDTEYSFINIVGELKNIWRKEGNFRSTDGEIKNQRVVEIGNLLNQKGGFQLMQAAWREIRDSLGGVAAGTLDKVWNDIGDWVA